jgi:hypothetical protein
MTERQSAVTAGETIPVLRVLPDIIFETALSAGATALNPGDKVTLGADGLTVTGTTTGGVAEIVSAEGITAGSRVRVRFAPS